MRCSLLCEMKMLDFSLWRSPQARTSVRSTVVVNRSNFLPSVFGKDVSPLVIWINGSTRPPGLTFKTQVRGCYFQARVIPVYLTGKPPSHQWARLGPAHLWGLRSHPAPHPHSWNLSPSHKLTYSRAGSLPLLFSVWGTFPPILPLGRSFSTIQASLPMSPAQKSFSDSPDPRETRRPPVPSALFISLWLSWKMKLACLFIAYLFFLWDYMEMNRGLVLFVTGREYCGCALVKWAHNNQNNAVAYAWLTLCYVPFWAFFIHWLIELSYWSYAMDTIITPSNSWGNWGTDRMNNLPHAMDGLGMDSSMAFCFLAGA